MLIDPHNYARYFGKIIGGPEVSYADFADFWERLAVRFKDSPQVWFGLMNEPHDLPNAQWLWRRQCRDRRDSQDRGQEPDPRARKCLDRCT